MRALSEQTQEKAIEQEIAEKDTVTDKNEAVQNQPPKKRGRAWWTLVFIAIAVASIWAVVSQTKDFSFTEFMNFIGSANLGWLSSAIVSTILFIVFEALSILIICRSFGYKRSFGRGFVYSAADIYFSAITPSATGGQPASAFFMMKDDIPGTLVTMSLMVNLVMYTAATVVLGIIAILINPPLLLNFGTLSKVIILIGYIVQIALLVVFILLLTKKGMLHKLCRGALKLLAKLHLIRKLDKKLEALEKKMQEYSGYTHMLKGKGKLLFVVLILNILQRMAQTGVTPLTYLASGGEISEAFGLFLIQIYIMVGANCIPLPGAMGVTDYLMLDGFEEMQVQNPAFLELLSRSLSFYMCVIICGITILISYCALFKSKKRRKKYDRDL